jgi:hypothetical protein
VSASPARGDAGSAGSGRPASAGARVSRTRVAPSSTRPSSAGAGFRQDLTVGQKSRPMSAGFKAYRRQQVHH